MDISDIPWLAQPNLFLLSQGGVAQVWKCKRTISEALLMKRKDFVYVDEVENHLDLIKPLKFDWPEDGYKELVKYISERRLLVNGQGLVIAELPKFSPDDGKMDESVSPLFMWSLDIIALDKYMQHYIVRPIPFRPIQYLEDKNGPARDVQEVGLSPNELKLTAELEKENNDKKALDKEVADLNIKKKGLVDQVAKLEKDLAAKTKEANAEQQELDRVKSQLEGRVADLEGKNRNLESTIAQLTAELADLRRRIAALKQQLIGANNDKDALGRKIADLQDHLDTLIKNKSNTEPWMNGHSSGNWVGSGQLWKSWKLTKPLGVRRAGGVFPVENTTNVHPNYFSQLFGSGGPAYPMKVVVLQDLHPNSDKARFDPNLWGWFNNGGTLYVAREARK